MNRRNFAVSALALTAMALAPLSSCKKDGDKSSSGGAGAASEILGHLPKDTSAVLGISWAAARGTDMFKLAETQLLNQMPPEIADIKSKCGIDVIADIDAILVSSGKDMNNPDGAIVAVKGKIDKAKVEDCFTKMGGSAADGVYTMNGKPMNIHWASSNTMLMSKGLSADAMKSAAASGSIKDNADLSKLLGNIDTSSTFWAVGKVPPGLEGYLGMLGAVPKNGYVSLNISTGVGLTAGLVFDQESDASGAATKAKGMLPMAAGLVPVPGLLEKIDISSKGNALVVSFKLSGDDIKSMQSQMGM